MAQNVVVDRLSRRAGMRIVPGRALSAGSVSFALLERAFGRVDGVVGPNHCVWDPVQCRSPSSNSSREARQPVRVGGEGLYPSARD